MAQLQNYWRIITPASRKQLYTTVAVDSYDPRTGPTDLASLHSNSWYSQVMKGAGTRQGQYRQFDNMDRDIDISRSLDIIAEEMSSKDEKTNLPFEITYQKEDNEDISDTTAITLRATVRAWAETQQLNTRVFKIARTMVKYGDCFFRKYSDTSRWEFIAPMMVYGIEVDALGNKVAYHLKKQTQNTSLGIKNEQYEVVPASAIVHFTLSDDMGDQAPFGVSVLQPIHRVYNQLAMLEDATIIYRIVRAPERRVFYIDTGNMPPQRVKQYMQQVRDEIRQKKTPGMNGGKEVVDGQYDASSIQEDMFFPVTAAGRGSRVETLPGGSEDFGTVTIRYFQDKIFRGLRIPTSYMSGTDGQGAQYNDGKVGIAYIEEGRFAEHIRRLQDRLDEVFDQEFKIYLKVTGIKVDDEIFNIRLPDPANFALYRQAALDADLISSYNNISNDKTISTRFKHKRYLGLTDDEIQMNEAMLKEERGIKENTNVSPLQQMYDPAVFDNRDAITPEETSNSSFGGSGGGGGSDEAGFFSGDAAESEPEAAAPPAEETPETPTT